MKRILAALVGSYLACCVPAFLLAGITVGGHQSITDASTWPAVLTATALVAAIIWAPVAIGWGAVILIIWAVDS